MAYLTLFSTPKPFTDPFISTIQRNAIRSWVELGQEVEVILIGDEPGLREVSQELGARHIPQVERNQWGTPLVRSLFDQARSNGSGSVLAVVNADIILMDDFLRAIRQVDERCDEFLIVCRRWGLNIEEGLAFYPGWQDELRREVKANGQLHPIFSIDFFAFPRAQYQVMPDFVIGRPQWDNWMIYHARESGWPVIDVTPSVLAVHQNHDYRHLPGGQPPHGLEEGRMNRELAGGERAKYMIIDAEKCLRGGAIHAIRPSMERFLRGIERWLMRMSFRGLEWRAIHYIRRLRVAVGEPLPEGWVAGGLTQQREDPA
jgi:hypothetical protein